MSSDSVRINTDIAIIGGGIAGLMLQARLNNLGYSTVLLEQTALGSGQTLKAQGIIHGGIKYALLGQLTQSARAISLQPKIWSSYLTNNPLSNNHLNLAATKILSTHHDLWNNGNLKNQLKQMLMQKTLSSQGEKLDCHNPNYPNIFKNKQFRGSIYQINETVIDMSSLIFNLAQLNQNKIIKIDQDSLKIDLNKSDKYLNYLTFTQDNRACIIKAQQYVFTSGQNNSEILDLIPELPKMQLRPLHMVLAKFPEPNILYGHYIGSSMLPELTVTTHYSHYSHYSHDNNTIWYLGGKIAETGINLTQDEQIKQAKSTISKIFPWLDISHWQWSSFFIDRAEPLQPDGSRPDQACFSACNNTIVAWPIKMALAPMLCDKIINYFEQNNITNIQEQINSKNYNLQAPLIAKPIWDELI
ncbi:MAG: FAD-dependent oxidoreductase [Gammaproteobacteria bacterium]|nr:FAD-dependent oxidoreductase [Gammaproteobacteria bacterium]